MSDVKAQQVTIAAGASESSVLQLFGRKLTGLLWPSAWTAADLTFLVCLTPDGTFVPLYDDSGVEAKILSANLPAAESRGISLDYLAGTIAQWEYVKLRSGVKGAAVNQVAARTIGIALKD